MTTKHSQPQSTFAKSLTSASTNTPYFKAAGTRLHCFSFIFLSWAFFLAVLSSTVRFLNYVLGTCTCFHSAETYYKHCELLSAALTMENWSV